MCATSVARYKEEAVIQFARNALSENKYSDFKTTAEMSSDVSTALNIGIVVLWFMTPCKLMGGYRRVGVSGCLLLLH